MENFTTALLDLSDNEITPPHAKKVWERIASIGFPYRKKESYLHFPLPILEDILTNRERGKNPTDLSVIPECKNSYLLIQDGSLIKERSCYKDLSIYSLKEAYSTYGIYLERKRQKALLEDDPFYLTHLAAPSNGLFLYLPENKRVELPLQILSTVTRNALTTIYIHLGEGASLDLFLHSCNELSKSFSNLLLDITLEKKANLRLIDYSKPSQGSSFHFVRANLKESAVIDMQVYTKGGAASRGDYKITLEGEGAHAHLQGLSQLSSDHLSHLHTEVRHETPSATSKQEFRSIISERGQYRFAGKIYVTPEAQQTDSHQLCENLLLSDMARAFVQPNLEIFADDVKASHGATLSKLDESSLFYLKSRGIHESRAKQLLVRGFAKKALASLWLPSLKAELAEEEDYDTAST